MPDQDQYGNHTEAEIVKRVGYSIALVGIKTANEGAPEFGTLIDELKGVAKRLKADCDDNMQNPGKPNAPNLPNWPIGQSKVGELLQLAGKYISILGNNYKNFDNSHVTCREVDNRGVVQIGGALWEAAPPFEARAESGGDACAYTIDGEQYCENYPPNYCFNIGGNVTNQTCGSDCDTNP